ncbi:MAG: minor capsid protein [Streptococcaceae bacterium]|jgi:SPP1 gp7 family putative phage head morphogenesis protein|nr:minor capsid protein [Streptococcaceae bacterium]
MVEDKDFSEYANQLMSMYNMKMKVSRLELLKDEIRLDLFANGVYVEKYFGKTLTDEAKAEYRRQAGILGDTLKTLDTSDVKHIINGSFHNATFSDRIWSSTNALNNRLDTFLTQSIINGRHPNDVARDVRKMFDVSRAEAERLMRTESARVQADVTMDSYKQAGIDKYEWIAEPGACSICSPLDGKTFDRDKAEYGVNMFPMHPNCRCAVMAAVDEDERLDNLGEKGYNKNRSSGALNDENDPYQTKRIEVAERYYDQLRNSDRERLVNKFSEVSNLDKKVVSTALSHILDSQYMLGIWENGEYIEKVRHFDPSFDMTQSLIRLNTSKPLKHDVLMLEHENLEAYYMDELGMAYDPAHKKTNLKYNYEFERKKWERSLKKHD